MRQKAGSEPGKIWINHAYIFPGAADSNKQLYTVPYPGYRGPIRLRA